jgi:hypothetical protein
MHRENHRRRSQTSSSKFKVPHLVPKSLRRPRHVIHLSDLHPDAPRRLRPLGLQPQPQPHHHRLLHLRSRRRWCTIRKNNQRNAPLNVNHHLSLFIHSLFSRTRCTRPVYKQLRENENSCLFRLRIDVFCVTRKKWQPRHWTARLLSLSTRFFL